MLIFGEIAIFQKFSFIVAVFPAFMERVEDNFDIFERPHFSGTGILAHNKKGVWKWECPVNEDLEKLEYFVAKRARNLGFMYVHFSAF